MSALDKSFTAISEKHELLSLGVTCHRGHRFAVSLQWADASGLHGRGCVIEHGDTIAEALANAVEAMTKERVGQFADEALTAEAA